MPLYRFNEIDYPVTVRDGCGREIHTAAAVDTDEGWADIILVARCEAKGVMVCMTRPEDPTGAPMTVRVQGKFTVERKEA